MSTHKKVVLFLSRRRILWWCSTKRKARNMVSQK